MYGDRQFAKYYSLNPEAQLTDIETSNMEQEFLTNAYSNMVGVDKSPPRVPPTKSTFRGFGGGKLPTSQHPQIVGMYDGMYSKDGSTSSSLAETTVHNTAMLWRNIYMKL